MNVALDRDPATPVSFQAELRRDGGVVGRYDLPHPATNFAIAAFGETAVSVHGGVTNAATVRRVDGAAIPETSLAEILRDATRFELVWRAAEGDPDADPDGDGLTTRDEIGRHGTDPKQADTDGDGLSDASEILLGSNPLDADEDGDGVPDGIDPATWAAHPLWAANGTNGANVSITLMAPIPTNAAATLLVGDLAIPLRDPDTWTFSLEPGVAYAYRLFVTDGATANLAITNDVPGPPMRGATSWGRPLWDEGTGGVFDGPSFGGEGEMAIPVLSLLWEDPQDGSHRTGTDICLHGGTEARFSKSLLPLIADSWILDNLTETGDALILSVPRAGETFEGRVELDPAALRFGSVYATVSAHRCDASPTTPFCSICGHYQPEDLALSVRTPLTLKHDNQTTVSIVHASAPGETHSGGTIAIRRKNGGAWMTLGGESELNPWTAKIAGTFELRGTATVNGREYSTPVAEVEVMFPSYGDIIGDVAVSNAMDAAWSQTKSDCKPVPNERRELGFWIRLDTLNDTYQTTPLLEGGYVTPTGVGSLDPNPRPAESSPSPPPNATGATYVVGLFHTHTPRTYLTPTNWYRLVGPSPADDSFHATQQVVGVVCDYVGTPHAGSLTNRLYNGHLKDDPARLYPVSPDRRPTP